MEGRPQSVQHAIWLYLRFTLSYRDVEALLAERGLEISYETVRRWVLKFGPLIARKLRLRPSENGAQPPIFPFVRYRDNAPARRSCYKPSSGLDPQPPRWVDRGG